MSNVYTTSTINVYTRVALAKSYKPNETIMGGQVDLRGRSMPWLNLRPARLVTRHFGPRRSPLLIVNWQAETRICLHSPRDGAAAVDVTASGLGWFSVVHNRHRPPGSTAAGYVDM